MSCFCLLWFLFSPEHTSTSPEFLICSLLLRRVMKLSSNIVIYKDSCLTSSVNLSVTTANKKGLSTDPLHSGSYPSVTNHSWHLSSFTLQIITLVQFQFFNLPLNSPIFLSVVCMCIKSFLFLTFIPFLSTVVFYHSRCLFTSYLFSLQITMLPVNLLIYKYSRLTIPPLSFT